MKLKTIAVVALLSAALALSAQDLRPSATLPVADGRLESGEYSLNRTIAGMKLGLSLSADGSTLYGTVESPATGWVGLGFGSPRMDGAYILIAYVKGGESPVLEQRGKGHTHAPSGEKKLRRSVVVEAGGKTTLEIELPAADFVRNGKLQLILAYGRTDDVRIPHSARSGIEFTVGK